MNAEPGDYEKHDYGGRAKHHSVPGVSNESSQRSACVHPGEEGKNFVVSDCNPQRQYESQGIQNRVMRQPSFEGFLADVRFNRASEHRFESIQTLRSCASFLGGLRVW